MPTPTNVYPIKAPSHSPSQWASRHDAETALRGEIGGLRTVVDIRNILSWLVLGHVPNYASPRGLPNNPEATLLGWQPLLPTDVHRLKVVLDANLKLLNKVLPDLKSLDFNDQTPQPQLSDLELAARVASLVGRRQSALAQPGPPSGRGFRTPGLPIEMVPPEVLLPVDIVHEARSTPLFPQTLPAAAQVPAQPDWI